MDRILVELLLFAVGIFAAGIATGYRMRASAATRAKERATRRLMAATEETRAHTLALITQARGNMLPAESPPPPSRRGRR